MKKISILFMLLLGITSLHAQQFNITGTVIDKKLNEPIIGATVQVKGTNNGTVTNLDGEFALKNVAKGSVLNVSYIGYVTQSISLNGAQTSFRIELSEDSKTLDEVVVVGFGTQKKVNLTGAVASVDTKALASRPVSQVGQALQGVVPGLNLSTPDLGGQLGQTMNVNIRGTGTIGKGSSASPLILIDGMEGNMNNLNPEDIENISVLKDAASSSIYGSRAANGVVLVTTKQGKSGKIQVSYDGYFGWQNIYKMPNTLNAQQYMALVNEKNFNDDMPIYNWQTQLGDYTWQKIQNGWEGTNWLKEMRNKNALMQNHAVNLTGGGEISKFSAGFSYTSQDGIIGKGVYQTIPVIRRVSTQTTLYSRELIVTSLKWERISHSTIPHKRPLHKPLRFTMMFMQPLRLHPFSHFITQKEICSTTMI